METFAAVRALARECRRTLGVANDVSCTAQELLTRSSTHTGIPREAVPDDDIGLCGAEAVLDRELPAIFYKASTPDRQSAVHQAHEFGHHWIDGAGATCDVTDLSDSLVEDPPAFGVQRVEGYSAREHRECAANVFAREFLLPSPLARHLFMDAGLKAEAIAQQLGLPVQVVHQQLARALLLPEVAAEDSGEVQQTSPPLDDSQKAAAQAAMGPVLLEAGPGTGKTRTLVARIAWLCETGVDPGAILALTYSNKAAAELRERVARELPAAAASLWAGTFHSFGLNLLRQYGDRLGLPANPRLLDLEGGLEMLESILPDLPLHYYLQLHEPTLALADILKAISRAKDELVSPARYLELALAMREAAATLKDIEAAERALEVAAVYDAYEGARRQAGTLDFGGLLQECVTLLTGHQDIRDEVRTRFRHIVVDEFQDVNRASAALLELIAGNGDGLWVVGDARQSIYRFRGAAPQNIREFANAYPGTQRMALSTNYRSSQAVVSLVEAFAPMMKASNGGLPARWTAARGTGLGAVSMSVGTTALAEGRGIADAIRTNKLRGTAFAEQAILCRSHTSLARIAALLEEDDIPVLYMGDLFERPEIRDLLALLSVAAEPGGSGLIRVAGFADYAVDLADVERVAAFCDASDIPIGDALNHLDAIDLSEPGRRGLGRLAEHIGKTNKAASPIVFLTDYLFTTSDYLRVLLAREGVAGQQARLAVYQFLQLALGFRSDRGNEPKRAYLDWVRRLEIFGDERQLRAPPAAAGSIDAVRLLTVHASKGLEFAAVHLPVLANGSFPASRQYDPCPPPMGLIVGATATDHEEEEECLFFVALSRARDTLHLSRADSYSASRKVSPLLVKLADSLPSDPCGAACWQAESVRSTSDIALPAFGRTLALYRSEDLDQYLRCPRTYLYQRVLGFSGGREDNGYVRFHRCVYSVLRTLASGVPLDLRQAQALLDEAWQRVGPIGHPFEALYRREADRLLARALVSWSDAEPIETDWSVVRPGGTIRVRPDMVERRNGGLVVRRFRTGRAPKTPPDDDLYALFHLAARQHHAAPRVEVVYLGSDEVIDITMSDRVLANRLEKYDSAIRGIAAGLYPAKPNDRTCPRCPQYFVCPAPSEG